MDRGITPRLVRTAALALLVLTAMGCATGGYTYDWTVGALRFKEYEINFRDQEVGEPSVVKTAQLYNNTDRTCYLTDLTGISFPFELVEPPSLPLEFGPGQFRELNFRVSEMQSGLVTTFVKPIVEESIDREIDGAGIRIGIELRTFGITRGNEPPEVDAGTDLVLNTLPNQYQLEPTVSDDCIPGRGLSYRWGMVSGPSYMSLLDFIDDPWTTRPTVSSPIAGTITLSLSVSDFELKLIR